MADLSGLHARAMGLRLHRIVRENLIACEAVYFDAGRAGVDIVLRRASISGRVEIDGEIDGFFADVLTDLDGSCEQTIALDRESYGALKNRWMRCRIA